MWDIFLDQRLNHVSCIGRWILFFSYFYFFLFSPIPISPPTSLFTWSLWVFPVHQPRALVSCIQPGLVICFTLDNIHVSMLFSWNVPYHWTIGKPSSPLLTIQRVPKYTPFCPQSFSCNILSWESFHVSSWLASSLFSLLYSTSLHGCTLVYALVSYWYTLRFPLVFRFCK